MLPDIKEILLHCETSEKHIIQVNNPKSVIPLSNGEPYKQWAIDVIGPMPNNPQHKRFIITAIDYCTRWPVARATKVHDDKAIQNFIETEIISKF